VIGRARTIGTDYRGFVSHFRWGSCDDCQAIGRARAIGTDCRGFVSHFRLGRYGAIHRPVTVDRTQESIDRHFRGRQCVATAFLCYGTALATLFAAQLLA
jgi:hypothetical protein